MSFYGSLDKDYQPLRQEVRVSAKHVDKEAIAMTDTLPMFPFMHPDPCTPPPEYAELRQAEPVTRVALPSGDIAWLVTSHTDVRAVLADSRFSREALAAPDAPPILPVPQSRESIFFIDPPKQTRLRRLVAPTFSPERVERFRPRIEQIVQDLLDSMAAAGPPADLITCMAKPLPILVLCMLLGVPRNDIATFREWTDQMFVFDAHSPDEAMAAYRRIDGYIADMVKSKRTRPTDDLLTDLINARENDDRLSEDELIAFVHDLLGAGNYPVAAEIVHGVLAVLREPEQFYLLQSQPELVVAAVEELMRQSQSAGGGLGSVRLATKDVQLGNVTIRAGEVVVPSLNAANLDEAVFVDPQRLHLSRRQNPHLAFGDGIHHCLGIWIGRVVLQTAFATVVRRFPKLRLAQPESELVWSPGLAFRTPDVVLVEW